VTDVRLKAGKQALKDLSVTRNDGTPPAGFVNGDKVTRKATRRKGVITPLGAVSMIHSRAR